MLNAYPKIRNFYIAMAFIGGIAIELALPFSIYVNCIFAVVYIFALAQILDFYASKRLRECTKIRAEQCIVTSFLEENRKLLDKKLSSHFRNICLINTGTGLMDLGRYDEVLSYMNQLQLNLKKRVGLSSAVASHLNLGTYYLRTRDFDQAEFHYSKAHEFMSDSRLFEKTRMKYEEIYQYNMLTLEVYKGTNDNLDYFLNAFSQPVDFYRKVISASTLSFIYQRHNDLENEKKYLEFVAENGNELYCVKEAQERLHELKKM